MIDWHPIDTAPKGGFPPDFTGDRLTTDPAWVDPPRILAVTRSGELVIVYWDWYYAEGGNGYEVGRTAWVTGDGPLPEADAPTHWMPLPDPPAGRHP